MKENKRPCETCKHNEMGVLHGYWWMTCEKNWSDKQHGQMYGVIKNTCDNWKPRPEIKE